MIIEPFRNQIANAYLISWTKLEGTRPVSFASLVPFKKPSKFKLEITFIISFFCIMLLFWIKFQFPSKSSEFILSPKFPANGQWTQFSNVDSRSGSNELWKASSLITNLVNPVPDNKIRMKMGFFLIRTFRKMTIISASFLVSCDKNPSKSALFTLCNEHIIFVVTDLTLEETIHKLKKALERNCEIYRKFSLDYRPLLYISSLS